MVVILVKSSWIEEIGELVEGFLLVKHSDDLKILYASKTEMEFPFVYADIARTSGEGKTFVPIHIPNEAIRGMFDMTEAEKKKLGFS